MDAGPSSLPDGINPEAKINDSLWKLYSPAGKPSMEIIFFHGLQLGEFKDAFWKTWRVKGSEKEVWPIKWLSKMEGFSTARMLSVSFNSSATRTDGQLRMYTLGENLVRDIILERTEDIGQDCPVFLVGHSWGGIVIKQLVLSAISQRGIMQNNSRASRDEINRITKFLDNIRGVYYYATPHLGSSLAELGSRLLPRASPILELLGTLNETTSIINSNFQQQRNIPAAAMAEGLDTSYGSYFFFHLYKGRVVKPASARSDIDNFYTNTIADHLDVCKAENPKSAVIRKLTEFIAGILLTEAETVTQISDLPNPPSSSSNQGAARSSQLNPRITDSLR